MATNNRTNDRPIDIGTDVGSTGGEPIRDAFDKINQNFDDLFGIASNFSSVNRNIIPAATETYDIGNAVNRFRDIYLSGNTIHLGNTNISVNQDGELEFSGVKIPTQTDLDATIAATSSGALTGTLTGDVYATDSTLLVDAQNGKIVGPVEANVTGNVDASLVEATTITAQGGTLNNTGGSVNLVGANGALQGGGVTVAGAIGVSGDGGNVNIAGGIGSSGDGGAVSFVGGTGTVAGGNAVIAGGAGDTTGGNVFINAGPSAGTDGQIFINGDVTFVNNKTVDFTNANVTGLDLTLDGELKGSVFADDSTLLVDGVNGSIPYSVISDVQVTEAQLNVDFAAIVGTQIQTNGLPVNTFTTGDLEVRGTLSAEDGSDFELSSTNDVNINTSTGDENHKFEFKGDGTFYMSKNTSGNNSYISTPRNDNNAYLTLVSALDLIIEANESSGSVETWTFKTTGALEFPDGSEQTTAWTGVLDGDLTGSVFADDSTLLVDGVNGKIVGNIDITGGSRIDLDTDSNFYITNTDISTYGLKVAYTSELTDVRIASNLRGGTIDTPATLNINGDVDVDGNLFVSDISATSFENTTGGTTITMPYENEVGSLKLKISNLLNDNTLAEPGSGVDTLVISDASNITTDWKVIDNGTAYAVTNVSGNTLTVPGATFMVGFPYNLFDSSTADPVDFREVTIDRGGVLEGLYSLDGLSNIVSPAEDQSFSINARSSFGTASLVSYVYSSTDGSIATYRQKHDFSGASTRFIAPNAVPSTSKGESGDKQGYVAFGASYIFYCTADYTDGVADIWKRVAWSGDTW